MEIVKIRPGGPIFTESAAEVGDILVEVDGRLVDEQLIKSRGDQGTFFVISTSDTHRAPTGIISGHDEPPISNTGIAVSLFVIGAVFALTSFLVFFRPTRSVEILVLSLLLIVFAIGFVIAPAAARWFHWAMLAERLITAWVATLFIMFFFLFPFRRTYNRPISAAVLYGGPFGTLVISILYILAFEMESDIYLGLRPVAILQVATGLLGGLALLVAALVTTNSPVMKEQLRIMMFGIVAAILPFVLLTVVPQSVGGSPYIRPEISVLGIVFIPLTFSFAILRYQLMDIRRFVHHGAAYALISFTVLIIYGVLIAVLRLLAGTEVSETLGLQLTLMVLLFAVLPFVLGARRVAYVAVDRLLYREYLDHPELTKRLSVDAATAKSADELSTSVLGTLVTELRLSFASFSSVVNDSTTLYSSIGTVPKGLGTIIRTAAGKPLDGPVYYSNERVMDTVGKRCWLR
ncbi:MAG: hypothetical protein BZY87_07485 [SAR202 cluster bacterium Io17-Chloro-G6]|nr:MAG: hypothetical protein BZY87_07485 [SAR202 cluster bacterium Io17-Chloro-G6]